MKILFAKNLGFCFGVRRAIEIANQSFKKDPAPIYFLGDLINNEVVIEEMKRKGGKFISRPEGARSGTLIIRAHGMPPFKSPKGVLIRDATCPLVKRVQEAARLLLRNGYTVIIVGDKNHPEVKGIKGYTKNKAVIVESKRDLRKMKNFQKIGVVAQTTQNLEQINQVLKVLEKKAKKLKWVNTLCPEVAFRQKELVQILKKAGGVLVIGSRSSANTGRLVKIAKKSKKPVWQVNSLEDLKKQSFGRVSLLGVVSGTSTPDWEVEKIRQYLLKR